MSLGKKINQFEALPEQTLKEFNAIFNKSPIEGDGTSEVEIGEVLGPATVRRVTIGNRSIAHRFNELDESAELILAKEGAFEETNAESENEVMTKKEMELEPLQYMLLQYLRGCTSQFHTQIEIAEKLGKSNRTIREAMRDMEGMGIFTVTSVKAIHRLKVVLTEEWR
jgi:biotin operon repressor